MTNPGDALCGLGMNSQLAQYIGPKLGGNVQAVSVKQFGAIGNGVTDDTAAIQAAINSAPQYGTVYFPPGSYPVSSTINCVASGGAAPKVNLMGERNSSFIHGAVNGPIFSYVLNVGAVTAGFSVSRLHINNNQAAGFPNASCIAYSGVVTSAITECWIESANVGLNGVPGGNANVFTMLIQNCTLSGGLANAGSIGILAQSHTSIINCDITAWDNGVRLYGACCDVIGCRFEINKLGMSLGKDYQNNSFALTRSLISGNSMEANDVAIHAYNIGASVVSGIALQGSNNAPSGQSQVGIWVSSGGIFDACQVGGTHSVANWIIDSGSGAGLNMRNCQGAVNPFAGGVGWDFRSDLSGAITFDTCDITFNAGSSPDLGMAYRTRQSLGALTQTDFTKPSVRGQNLRGVAVPVTTAATSTAIAFIGTVNGNIFFINGAPVASNAAGTLPPATYFYVCAGVIPNGEIGAGGEQSVVVSAPNNTVTLSFFGVTAPPFFRRLYRGHVSGVYDGYYDLPLNSSASFVDTNAAFTGKKQPCGAGIGPASMLEPDANYAVIVTPSWGTTVSVTAKATTGFTINFGTAAPAGGTVDWLIVR